MQKIKPKHILLLWVLLCFGIAIKDVFFSAQSEVTQTVFNNYNIFKYSFFHFWDGRDLYAEYPAEHYDFYKYSPTFSMLFGIFALLPNWLGLALWNSLNVVVLLSAIFRIGKFNPKLSMLAVLLMSQELYISTINEQSNALIVGMALWAYIFAEEGKTWQVVTLIWLTVFIKLFGILLFIPLFLFRQRIKFILFGFLGFFILAALPLLRNNYHWYATQISDYLELLGRDQNTFVKYSVMAWVKQWFGLKLSGNMVVLVGLFLQIGLAMILYFKRKLENKASRLLYWLSWLIWLVIFNHMAESPTYIIAVSAVVLWFILYDHKLKYRLLLLVFVVIFTSFGTSDLIPKTWQPILLEQFQLKVFPCILIWLVIWLQLFGFIQPKASFTNSD